MDSNSYNNKNLSAVLSLKTELLRKKNDILKLKNCRSREEYEANETELKYKNVASKHDDANSKGAQAESEDKDVVEANLLEKSQRILHKKAEVYDRMSALQGHSDAMKNSLISFERKTSLKPHHSANYDSDNEDDDDDDDIGNDGFVEYIDEFGRTRKCTPAQFREIQQENISCSLKKDNPEPSTSASDICFNELTNSEKIDIIDHDKKQETLLGWQQKTVENAHKEELHYQDVFFDEARQHGVGYYNFSTDDTERLRQQKELELIRQKTLEEQKHRSIQKSQQDSIKARRVLAAKNRKRARFGLPPLSLEDSMPEEDKQTNTTNEIDEKLNNSEPESEPDVKRSYNRPWDEGKEKEWFVKTERSPLSQDEWNERKRKERIKEFAPPTENRNSSLSTKIRNLEYRPSIADIEAKLNEIRNYKN